MTAPLLPGDLRRHPSWPTERAIAMRTIFGDGQYPGWTPWIKVTPTGSEFVSEAEVASWPTVAVTDQT